MGETGQPLHLRINNHRADVAHKRVAEKPVAAHFNTNGHSADDMTVMVIERLWRDDPILRKIRESRWIASLDTSCPSGMNLRTDSL